MTMTPGSIYNGGWFGAVATALVTSTKLSYVEPG